MYEYAVWVALLLVVWLAFYLSLPKLRKKMLWSSLILLPFGATQYFFLKYFWDPGTTLFNLHNLAGMDIESFGYSFAIGGIASALYEAIFRENISKAISLKCGCKGIHWHLHYQPVLFLLVAFFFLWTLFGLPIYFSAIIAMHLTGLLLFIARKDLRRHIVLGGLAFFLVYSLLLVLVNALFPHWFHRAYTMAIPIFIGGIPLEEFLGSFGFGLMWAAMYEAVKGYVIKKGR